MPNPYARRRIRYAEHIWFNTVFVDEDGNLVEEDTDEVVPQLKPLADFMIANGIDYGYVTIRSVYKVDTSSGMLDKYYSQTPPEPSYDVAQTDGWIETLDNERIQLPDNLIDLVSEVYANEIDDDKYDNAEWIDECVKAVVDCLLEQDESKTSNELATIKARQAADEGDFDSAAYWLNDAQTNLGDAENKSRYDETKKHIENSAARAGVSIKSTQTGQGDHWFVVKN